MALRADAAADFYLRTTHKYAHALVATQGRDWCDAARRGWRAFKKSGVDGIIDDDVTDRILLFGGYVGGAVLATLFAVTAPQSTDAAWLLGAAIIFALGFSAVTQPLTVLEASASTLFVTYAQVPEVLASTHPILFHRFQRLTEVFLHTRGHAAVEAVGVRPPRDLDDI